MYNPPPPSSSGGSNPSYYRQPSSTPNVSQPMQSSFGKAPPLNSYGPPPPNAPPSTGGPNSFPPPPPPIAGGFNQGPPPGQGGFNQGPPGQGGFNQGPPPGQGGYNQGPPQGYNQGPPQGGYNQGPPPGQYNQPGQYGPPPLAHQNSGINLTKDQHISLNKQDPYLRNLHIGLGWDVNQYNPNCPFDLDAIVFMLGPNGMVQSNADFIFYNNKQSRDGAVFHHGDNLSGVGEGDDEVIGINLLAVSPTVTRMVFAVTIHDPDTRRQNFSMVPRAFIRIANKDTGRNVCRYDLTGEGGYNTALICGEVYRDGPEWKFTAVGKSFPGGLKYLCQIFGVSLTG